jgi:hypothetical protein
VIRGEAHAAAYADHLVEMAGGTGPMELNEWFTGEGFQTDNLLLC